MRNPCCCVQTNNDSNNLNNCRYLKKHWGQKRKKEHKAHVEISKTWSKMKQTNDYSMAGKNNNKNWKVYEQHGK